MLSIGKLAQMAGSEAPLDDRALDRKTGAFLSYVEHSLTCGLLAFHDGLDYISVHENLIEELRTPLSGTKARQSIENQVDIVAKAVASKLKAYPAFLAVSFPFYTQS